MTDYLTPIEVLAIHEDQLSLYGGIPGIRDLGLLEAALYRPQTGYYADLIEEAAALWESLSQNQPFLDGNKRTAFASMFAFLAINQVRLAATAADTVDFITQQYERGSFGFDTMVPWLRHHSAT